MTTQIEKNLRYTKEHEWIRLQNQSIAQIGITDHAQSSLGDIVYVELPEIGKTIQKSEALGTIESVKAVSEVYAPASGKIVKVNQALLNHPEQVNTKPYTEGWIAEIELQDPKELETLLNAKSYETFLKENKA